MPDFFLLEPEVAGELGPETQMDSNTHPPTVHKLHYEFFGWLGDDLVETFPCYLVTERCGAALETARLSGLDLQPVKISTSSEYRELHGDRPLPGFRWLRVSGRVGTDDLFLAPDARLVVSEAALAVLRKFNLENCDVEEFGG